MQPDASRIADIAESELTPEQQRALRVVAGGRGRIPTPYKVWIHSPGLAAALAELGTFLNRATRLTAGEIELAILVAAHHWHGTYVEELHARTALALGVAPVLVDALRRGEPLPRADAREAVIAQFAWQATQPGPPSAQSFDQMIRHVGHAGIAELLALMGYYSAVALAMKAYNVPIPPPT